MKKFQAIAAMAENRVIGNGNKIPWHLPDDFKWFKAKTMGHILIMGRKTFESIGRPLPGRETIILSQSGYKAPGTRTVESLEQLNEVLTDDDRIPYICGGAEIYSQTLGQCSDLFLTKVRGTFEGDAYFPKFESLFSQPDTLLQHEQFSLLHYHKN